MKGNYILCFSSSVQKCYVSDGLVSIEDLELGSHVGGSSSSKSLCKSFQTCCLSRQIKTESCFVCVCMFVYVGRGDGPMSGRFSLVEHGNIINIGFHGFFLLR